MASPNNFNIISVGDELLNGHTLNTNLHILCKSIENIGGFVSRAYIVKDDFAEISFALNNSISDDSFWIIFSGGLGPTYDDITIEAISKSLDLPLKINNDALAMVKAYYDKLLKTKIISNYNLTTARKKMALFPIDGIPLKNNIGTAPGMLLSTSNKKIICLPGVPVEMQDILNCEVVPLIKSKIIKKFKKEIIVPLHGFTESDISPILKLLNSKYPDVYIKSHPKGFNEGISEIQLVISSVTNSLSNSSDRVHEVLNLWNEMIKKN